MMSYPRLGGIITFAYLVVQTIVSIVLAKSVGWFYIIWVGTAIQYLMPLTAALWLIIALHRLGAIRLNQLGLTVVGAAFPLFYIPLVCNCSGECR